MCLRRYKQQDASKQITADQTDVEKYNGREEFSEILDRIMTMHYEEKKRHDKALDEIMKRHDELMSTNKELCVVLIRRSCCLRSSDEHGTE